METKNVTICMNIRGTYIQGSVSVDTENYCITDFSDLNLSEEFLDKSVEYNDIYLGTARELITNEALYVLDMPDYSQCGVCGYKFHAEDMLWIESESMMVYSEYAEDYDGQYYLSRDFQDNSYRDDDGHYTTLHAPERVFDRELCWCESCQCYVSVDSYYGYGDGDGECVFCHDEHEQNNVIEGYCESHDHSLILFGEYKDEESFVGLGFELEVDCNCETSRHNNEVARYLCANCGLEEDEMRYAHDGSLNYGFECISQPHTVKAFWDRRESWTKMLKYLANNGYSSHDAGTCGLHVHVSRGMFGSTKEEQNTAIAKVYTFFDENWDDLVKVSRRKNFTYCEKNELCYVDIETTRFKAWKKKCKREGGHYVALNNKNCDTFEYRLGRGTLNTWSFFSWIDLVITITKNAKRITVSKVESNDKLSWLGGIKESTAKYIYKRGAFRKEMLALYPNIEWETDLTDSAD